MKISFKNIKNCFTWNTGDETQRPQDPECSQSFDIETFDLKGRQNGTDDTENQKKTYLYEIITLNIWTVKNKL